MVLQKIISDYPDEWLLALEVLEQLSKKPKNGHGERARNLLMHLKSTNPELSKLINDGMELIREPAESLS